MTEQKRENKNTNGEKGLRPFLAHWAGMQKNEGRATKVEGKGKVLSCRAAALEC